MLVDDLRELTRHASTMDQGQKISEEELFRLAFNDALDKMKASANRKFREAAVFRIDVHMTQWIDLSDIEPGGAVTLDRLRGLAQLLKNRLKDEGLALELQFQTEFSAADTTYHFYNLVASW